MNGIFWEIRQQRGIAEAHSEALAGASAASEAKREVGCLEDRVDKLTLVCMALWSLLKERGDFSEDDLMERVRQIDLMDGQEDGKVTRQVARCAKCNRVMSPRHSRCLYCGAQKLNVTAFDAVM